MSWWGAMLIWVLALGATWVVNVVYEWSLSWGGWLGLYLGIGVSLTLVALLWWPLVLVALVAMGVTKFLADWRGWAMTPRLWFLLYLGLTLGSVLFIVVLLLIVASVGSAGTKDEEG